MKIQNIFTVDDRVYCPGGEGEIIRKYLVGVFSRIAPQVIRAGNPVDWLVVKSSTLGDVTWSSQNFFEEMLEKALREHDKTISVVREHSIVHFGATSCESVDDWIKKMLQQENIQVNYLNQPDLDLGFVGYHLGRKASS